MFQDHQLFFIQFSASKTGERPEEAKLLRLAFIEWCRNHWGEPSQFKVAEIFDRPEEKILSPLPMWTKALQKGRVEIHALNPLEQPERDRPNLSSWTLQLLFLWRGGLARERSAIFLEELPILGGAQVVPADMKIRRTLFGTIGLTLPPAP